MRIVGCTKFLHGWMLAKSVDAYFILLFIDGYYFYLSMDILLFIDGYFFYLSIHILLLFIFGKHEVISYSWTYYFINHLCIYTGIKFVKLLKLVWNWTYFRESYKISHTNRTGIKFVILSRLVSLRFGMHETISYPWTGELVCKHNLRCVPCGNSRKS